MESLVVAVKADERGIFRCAVKGKRRTSGVSTLYVEMLLTMSKQGEGLLCVGASPVENMPL